MVGEVGMIARRAPTVQAQAGSEAGRWRRPNLAPGTQMAGPKAGHPRSAMLQSARSAPTTLIISTSLLL
jgi:hypothetical protein